MQVNISNKPAKIDRKEIIAAANFYANTLMNAQLVRNLKIDIEFENLHNIDAQCNWDDRNVRPRWFTIQIDNRMGRRKVLLNLAHEMVHVKQIAKGHYAGKCLRNGKVVPTWKGKVVQAKYLDRPWEIEAFKRESILAEMLFEYAEKRHKKAKNKKK